MGDVRDDDMRDAMATTVRQLGEALRRVPVADRAAWARVAHDTAACGPGRHVLDVVRDADPAPQPRPARAGSRPWPSPGPAGQTCGQSFDDTEQAA